MAALSYGGPSPDLRGSRCSRKVEGGGGVGSEGIKGGEGKSWKEGKSGREYHAVLFCRIESSGSDFMLCALVVLVVQWFGVGLVIERSLVRLSARALSTELLYIAQSTLRGR